MPNRVLRILFIYTAIFLLAGSLLGPFYAIYVQELGEGLLAVSYSTAFFLASTTFFTFAIAKLGKKFKHTAFMLATGFLIKAFCYFMFIFVSNFEQLMIIQFTLGLGEALCGPSFDTIFAEHLDKHNHVMDYSEWRVLANFVFVIGTTLGGFIISFYGFKSLFTIMSILAALSAAGILLNDFIEKKDIK